jgi:hypothetical protein
MCGLKRKTPVYYQISVVGVRLEEAKQSHIQLERPCLPRSCEQNWGPIRRERAPHICGPPAGGLEVRPSSENHSTA